MSPIKLQLRKRKGSKCDEYEATIPPKKRNLSSFEKENEILAAKNETPSKKFKKVSKVSKVLEETQTPNLKADKKKYKKNKLSSSESDDDDFVEMFYQLKKNGINTNFNLRKDFNVTPEKKKKESHLIMKSEVKDEKLFTPENLKKKTIDKSESISPKNKNKKQSLCLVINSEIKNEKLSASKINKRRTIDKPKSVDSSTKKKNNASKSNSTSKVPELEKLPEDLILNYKRTPRKVRRLEFEETFYKEKSIETTPRRSSRLSGILKEDFLRNEEKTPSKKICKTPKKSSSIKKKSSEPTTSINKIEQKAPTTPLEKARLSLHVSTTPDGLPCREKEYYNIYLFLKNKLLDKIGGCMYISGVPGTGKTATVKQAIHQLQICSEEGTVPNFKFVEINGMRLSDPHQVYVQIWQQLFNKKEKIPSDKAYLYLNNWFNKENKKNHKNSTVLLVDELDLICTKKQDVVYNLLDWPTQPHSRLIVLTIANTMDMPERLFKGRVTSRMGLTRLTFMPYSYKQLEEIVMARLKGLDAFVTDAVRLVSRKVAAVSGDARRALDICRRATELPQPNDTVKISHVEQAITEMTNSITVKIIRNCCQLEKLFLRSLSDLSFRSNVEEVSLVEVIDQLLSLCVLEGISRPTIASILNVSNRLRCCRLIFTHQLTFGISQKVMLNVTQDDIHYGLQNV